MIIPYYSQSMEKSSSHVPKHQPVQVIHLYLPIKSGDFPSDNDWLETTVCVHCFFSPVPPGGDRSSKAQSLRAAQFYLARSSILEEGGSKKHKETCMRYNTYILPMVHVFPPSSHIYFWISIAKKKQFLSTLEMALTFFFCLEASASSSSLRTWSL